MRQKKTGQPVRFEMTEQTRGAVDDYIKATGKKLGEFLFASRRYGETRTPDTRIMIKITWDKVPSPVSFRSRFSSREFGEELNQLRSFFLTEK